MDKALKQTSFDSKDSSSVGIFFAILAASAAIFIALGMKYSSSSGTLNGLSYYARYEGIPGGIIHHITSAAKCAAPCLIQLLSLYLLSFSPLLFPASFAIIGWRGFAAGAAYCAVTDPSAAMQLILYTAVTASICLMSALLLHYRKSVGIKTVALAASAGTAVIGELVLSYLI